MSDRQDTLLLIADIAGYTRFTKLHRTQVGWDSTSGMHPWHPA
ncbi:MAG TPA: hypothetical protein VJV77_03680 [Casimicrobiaceae bacterium]|nr:hypothetical protein [Casimicrobiaceae bacterium]